MIATIVSGNTFSLTISGDYDLEINISTETDTSEVITSPEFLAGDFTYSSTIDSITDLYAKYVYRANITSAPLLVLIHGYSTGADVFSDEVMRVWAEYGFFVVSVGMRGRNDASGTRDVSARELYDIYDAVQYIFDTYSNVDSSKIAIVGYSGGGGNALGMACKFPDFFNVSVDNFGMSDYGHDASDSWYATNGIAALGVPDAENADQYYSRYTIEGITNYQGYLYIYHDTGDPQVDVVHSQNIDAVLSSNYEYTESDDGTYGHAIPGNRASVTKTSEDYYARINTESEKTVGTTGTFRIMGYLVTKRFSIWLNTGTDAVADVVYSTVTGQYTITPITSGNIDVDITQGSLTASDTINTETTLTVS